MEPSKGRKPHLYTYMETVLKPVDWPTLICFWGRRVQVKESWPTWWQNTCFARMRIDRVGTV